MRGFAHVLLGGAFDPLPKRISQEGAHLLPAIWKGHSLFPADGGGHRTSDNVPFWYRDRDPDLALSLLSDHSERGFLAHIWKELEDAVLDETVPLFL